MQIKLYLVHWNKSNGIFTECLKYLPRTKYLFKVSLTGIKDFFLFFYKVWPLRVGPFPNDQIVHYWIKFQTTALKALHFQWLLSSWPSWWLMGVAWVFSIMSGNNFVQMVDLLRGVLFEAYLLWASSNILFVGDMHLENS